MKSLFFFLEPGGWAPGDESKCLSLLIYIFGADRSPRRGDLVCVCVCVSLSSKEHGKGVLESLRRGPDASKQAR